MRRPDFLWLCPILSVVLAAAILVALGLSLWTAILAAIVLACPIAALWAYFAGRSLRIHREPVPETRGMTLGWLAPVYDWWCARVGLGSAFRARTLEYAALKPGENVLDVGCGTGVLTRLASDAVGSHGHVVGFDPAPRMISVARRNAARAGSRAEFRLLAVEDLPFEDDCFDVALTSAVLHHLPADVKRAGLQEVWRVLKPSGRLLVVDLDRPNFGWWLLAWPLALMPTTAANMRGQIADYLRQAGFADVHDVGRWGGLLTFWIATKPARVGAGREEQPRTQREPTAAMHSPIEPRGSERQAEP